MCVSGIVAKAVIEVQGLLWEKHNRSALGGEREKKKTPQFWHALNRDLLSISWMPDTIVDAWGVAMNKTEATGNTHTHTLSLSLSLSLPSGIVILVE